MGWPQIVSGVALVLLVLAVAVYYGIKQVLALRALRRRQLPEEEHRYELWKAWGRLINSGLMLLLAGLLAGALLFLEAPAQQLADEGTSADHTEFVRLYGWYWVAILLTLLAVLLLAARDRWATRRWGIKQMQKLNAERRAMLQRQLTRLRQERNGEG